MSQEKITYFGTGRRKSSVARVRLIGGSGKFFINNVPGESYLNLILNISVHQRVLL